MTEPNTTGPRPGDQVRLEVEGEVLRVEDVNGVPHVVLWLNPGPEMLTVRAELVVLLPRARPGAS